MTVGEEGEEQEEEEEEEEEEGLFKADAVNEEDPEEEREEGEEEEGEEEHGCLYCIWGGSLFGVREAARRVHEAIFDDLRM